MKLQAASKKEISRIAVGTLVCDVIMIAGLFLLSQFGIGKFDILRILLGAACGTVVAILNFTILCLTVQNAVETDSKKKMRRRRIPDSPGAFCGRRTARPVPQRGHFLPAKPGQARSQRRKADCRRGRKKRTGAGRAGRSSRPL